MIFWKKQVVDATHNENGFRFALQNRRQTVNHARYTVSADTAVHYAYSPKVFAPQTTLGQTVAQHDYIAFRHGSDL